MSNEKRLVLTLVLSILSVYAINELMVRTGMMPPPQPPAPPAVVKAEPPRPADKPKARARPADPLANVPAQGELPADPFSFPPEPALRGPRRARASELVLGSDRDESPSAYHLRLQLDQRGASVQRATSAKYDAEFDRLAPDRDAKLDLIAEDPGSDAPGSLALTLTPARKAVRGQDADEAQAPVEAPLDLEFWEVVRDQPGDAAVRTATRPHPRTGTPTESQEVSFRLRAAEPSVEVTKVFRLWKGDDGFEVELHFANADKDSRFSYRLFGPHGIPIEGKWYTSTFRDVFLRQVTGTSTGMTTLSSTDVVKYPHDPSYRVAALPIKFAGVENQYFATFVQPWPLPRSLDDRWDHDAGPVLFHEDKKAPQESDVGVEIVSKPISVGPNVEVVHTYRVFAGPKSSAALLPYDADDLASYRKYQWFTIPFAATLSRNVIAPLLEKIHGLTESVARMVGWKAGNYGIAIILLTMTVRLIMFPLGRKQAMMAKKMQDLQPVLAEVKEKYKDDKEALTRETMAVWKRNKVNPAAGCVPALIQMPIFVGLWQTLNNSVELRHSTFLYIRDLAAPDMLFRFPFEVPFLGWYFNVLPFLVVALMLIQTKLFAPPPTTPEAEMNQKMMKYMMIFMAFMFYKVPSGLGLYFITSSLWQVCERLLLPKVIAQPVKPAADEDMPGDRGRGPGSNGKGPGPEGNGGNAPQGWLGKKIGKILEEAAKDKTIRNNDPQRERERERERDRDRDRTRPKPRPGKRR